MTTAKTKSTASLTLTIFSYCLGSNFFLHTVVYLVLNSFHVKDTLKQSLFCGWILFCCCLLFSGFFLCFVFLLFLFFLQNKEPYRRLWKSSLRSEVLVRSAMCTWVPLRTQERCIQPVAFCFSTSYNTLQSLQKFLSILDYCTFASVTTELHYSCPYRNISL